MFAALIMLPTTKVVPQGVSRMGNRGRRARDTTRDTDSLTVTRTMARVTRSATTSYPSSMCTEGAALVLSYRRGTPNVHVKQPTVPSRWYNRRALWDTPSRIVVRIALGCGTTTQCGTNASVPQKFEDCINTNSNLRITVPHYIAQFFGTPHW